MKHETRGSRIVKSSPWRALLVALLTLAPLSLGQQAHAATTPNRSATAPAVAQNKDGRLEVFTLQEDGTISHAWQTKPSAGPWSAWTSLGGSIASTPTVAKNRDGRLELFAVGTDLTLQHTWQTTAGSPVWTAWSSLGTGGETDLIDTTVATEQDGRLNILALNVKGELWSRSQNRDYTWAPWSWVGGNFVSRPAVGRSKDGRLVVFEVYSEVPTAHVLEWSFQDKPNGQWSHTWYSAPGRDLISDPSVASNKDGRLEVFANARNIGLVHIWQPTPDSYRMSNWSDFGGAVAGPPIADAQADGSLFVAFVDTDAGVLSRKQSKPNGPPWNGWQDHGGMLTQPLAMTKNADGRLEVFGVDPGGEPQHMWQTSANGPFTGWGGLSDLPGAPSGTGPE